ncbi:MAG: glycosyltransferase family 2 protein [Bacteroidota bacterium]
MDNAQVNDDRVSCLIVTADRKQLLRRALLSYKNQTHKNKEVVVVDNGHETVDDLLKDFSADEVQYVRIEPSDDNILGDLRNISLEQATGDFLVCWDDDDWFHPERIEVELNTLKQGYDACCLTGNIFHIDSEKFMEHPYIGSLPDGSPSSIMHRRDDNIRYPSLPRGEDTEYLNKWIKNKRYKQLDLSYSYLFVRVFHGTNVSGKKHFLRRLKNSPKRWLQYMWHAKIKGDVFGHPKFDLTEKEQEAFNMFLEDSRKLGIL